MSINEIENKTDADIIRDKCKNSLKFLCKEILGYWDWLPLHEEMEQLLNRPSSRKLILVPRDHLKSAIITKAWVIQQLLKNPNCRILISHGVQQKTEEMLREIKEYLTTKSVLPVLFGDFVGDTWKTSEIIIKQRTQAFSAASITATGMESESTSSHYDVIILDDLQTKENSKSVDLREKVKAYYRSMLDILERDGVLVIVGTRWDIDDYYADVFKYEKSYYEIMVKKVKEDGKFIFPRKFNRRWDTIDKKWAIVKDGQVDDYIDYLKEVKGAEYWGQYENNPLDLGNQLFKREYFKYWRIRPERLFIALTGDPAVSLKEAADESALVVGGMNTEYDLFILDLLHGKWRPSEFIDNVFSMYAKWHPVSIGIETVGMQMTFKYMLEDEMRRRNTYFPITELLHTSKDKKVMRIKALEPFWRTGKIYHATWMKDLEDQAMVFSMTKENRHDDILDALAMQLELLVPGEDAPTAGMPDNCWEAVAQRAIRLAQPHKDFFHHG